MRIRNSGKYKYPQYTPPLNEYFQIVATCMQQPTKECASEASTLLVILYTYSETSNIELSKTRTTSVQWTNPMPLIAIPIEIFGTSKKRTPLYSELLQRTASAPIYHIYTILVVRP